MARSTDPQRRLVARGSATPYHATRRRLVLINLGVVSAILLLMSSAIYLVERHALRQQVEGQLRSRASIELTNDETLAAIHQAQQAPSPQPSPTGSEGDGEGKSKDESYEPSSPNIFTIVLSPSGATLADASGVSGYGLPDRGAAAPVISGDQRDTLADVRIHDQEYLLYTAAVRSDDKLVGIVQVGQSLATMEQQTHDLLITLLIVGVGALTLTALASLYLADRALLPMRLAYDRQRQFAAAASHELRTPLAFVRSQLELVSRRLQRIQAGVPSANGATASGATVDAPDAQLAQGAQRESVQADLNETLDEVDYMTRLVRDLLLMARDEGDHRSIAWRPVELRALARDVAETALPSAQQRGLTLDDHTATGEPIWVMGDHDRLRQLLLILLDNATRYTPSGGHVWLEARSGRGSLLGGRRPLAQVIVGDTGVGIAHDQQERIFEAFYRPKGHSVSGASSDYGDHGGAGLGLALARWLVSAHEEDIAITSAPGEGSVFTVTLALRAEPHARDDDAATPTPQARRAATGG